MPAENMRFIYLACPWTPKGGGMYKVADYLIQAQAAQSPQSPQTQHASAGSASTQGPAPSAAAALCPLDTRGDGPALSSLGVLAKALVLLLRGRASGRLAGVHVNMAERLSLLRKGTVVVACRALGVPVVLHLHAAQLHHFYRRLPAPLRALTRWVFSLATSVVVLGAASKRFVTEELGVVPGQVEILINGVPEPSVARRLAPGPVLQLLFVGNLSDRKGVPELLQAMALPDVAALPLSLTLAGGGDVAGYTAQARALGLASDRVRFAGWSDQAAVARCMAEADMLVLPSHDEGLPLVILEALANGVAVVCTPVGEIPSVLNNGETALLVPPGNVAALGEALRTLALDAKLRERLERSGRALYAQHFSLGRFFAGIARIHRRHFGVAALPAQTLQARPEASWPQPRPVAAAAQSAQPVGGLGAQP
jgi:glycosyltransferase involved in cell wall biosynthesis